MIMCLVLVESPFIKVFLGLLINVFYETITMFIIYSFILFNFFMHFCVCLCDECIYYIFLLDSKLLCFY